MGMAQLNGEGGSGLTVGPPALVALGAASAVVTLLGLRQIVVELRRLRERDRYAYLAADENGLYRVERATGKLWRLVGTRAEAGLIFYEWQPMPIEGA